MTLYLAYAADLARVRVTADTLDPAAVTAVVERSLDSIRWQTVRGGDDVTIAAQAFALPVDDYEFAPDTLNTYRASYYDAGGDLLGTESATITPDLGGVPWLKIIARPFLNRPTIVADYSDIKRPAREAVFPVVGRSLPVVVSDLRLGREFTLTLLTETTADAEDTRYALSAGDVLLLQVPGDCDVPGGYYSVGDVAETRPARYTTRRLFALPVTEVEAPDASVVGSAAVWQTVVNNYATWADVLAAHATWGDVLELVGSPGDVVTS